MLTTSQGAIHLGLSERKVYNLAASGRSGLRVEKVEISGGVESRHAGSKGTEITRIEFSYQDAP